MKKANRTVRAHLDRNGIVIFRLMQGITKAKTIRTYGYGTHHKIWVQFQGHGSGMTSMTVEPAWAVKERIAEWTKE